MTQPPLLTPAELDTLETMLEDAEHAIVKQADAWPDVYDVAGEWWEMFYNLRYATQDSEPRPCGHGHPCDCDTIAAELAAQD